MDNNFDLDTVVTLVKLGQLRKLLFDSKYDQMKAEFLLQGFEKGFRLQYQGPKNRKNTSRNLPFNCGNKHELWSKIMKEVVAKRYAGPFVQIPFENYVQSPIGLVPKDGRMQMRLIFHLSYDFEDYKSVNSYTPKEKTTVRYNNLDSAVKQSLELITGIIDGTANIWYGKSDLKSTFRILGLNPEDFWLLVMMAKHPESGKTYYFVDKCLPFGHSISCVLFQQFSDALAHMVKYLIKLKKGIENTALTNYLDDFLFATLMQPITNDMIRIFLEMCEQLGVPISVDKTEFACNVITFLGILLDGFLKIMVVPEQKRLKALGLLEQFIQSKSVWIRDLQSLAWLLNFLNQAIIPWRAFTRRMYAKFSHILDKNWNKMVSKKFKPHHHIRTDSEFRMDCMVWKQFLELQETNKTILCRPFVDADVKLQADTLDFYTDAAKGVQLGIGGVFRRRWYFAQWEPNFIKDCDPSIEYLELLGVCMGVSCWIESLRNQRILLFCDNQSVVRMVNDTTSSCKNCMLLIHKLVLKCLQYNMRVFCRWVHGSLNLRADLLSRMKLDEFHTYVKLTS